MISPEFHQLLIETLSPISLIPSVGLFMLCMTARYIHATNRIRQLMEQRKQFQDTKDPDIDEEITILFRRALLLRRGTIALALSAVCTSILIAMTATHHSMSFDYDTLGSAVLILIVILLVAASVSFIQEIWISLHAIALVVHRLPPPQKKND